jgi:hypothetical protein
MNALGVPLRVWSPVATPTRELRAEWGGVEDVTTCRNLDSATKRLVEDIDR